MRLLTRIRNRIAGNRASRAVARYFNGEASAFMFNWRPALRDSREDVGQALRLAAARTIDAMHNSGWLAGTVDAAVAATVGNELMLNAKPDHVALGWDQPTANEWARNVERRFHAWASDPWQCDARGQQTLGQMTACVFRAWFAFGEITAELPLIRRAGSAGRTKVRLVSPHRLKNETREPDLVQGVFMDRDGLALAYRFTVRQAYGSEGDLDIRARDRDGRPMIVHVFDGMPGQVRGISPLAPVLKVLKQYEQLADATLTTALLQTIFAASVTSERSGDDAFAGLYTEGEGGPVIDYLKQKQEWYEASKLDLGVHGRINHLFPGETLDFHGAKHPNEQYEAFSKGLLREIARCAGVLYEVATGDFTDATYSSVRMGTSTIWPVTLYRRKHIAGRFCQQVYEAWLEEDIALGHTPFPGGLDAFVANRSAVTRGTWRGPPRPTADDLKSARADEIKLGNGTATLASLAAEDGEDWEDRADQLVSEVKRFGEEGLQHPFQRGATPISGEQTDELIDAD